MENSELAQDTSWTPKHAPGVVLHQFGRGEETNGEPRRGFDPTEWLTSFLWGLLLR